MVLEGGFWAFGLTDSDMIVEIMSHGGDATRGSRALRRAMVVRVRAVNAGPDQDPTLGVSAGVGTGLVAVRAALHAALP
jgi:hypothetical protein